jgi:hypothetical protein
VREREREREKEKGREREVSRKGPNHPYFVQCWWLHPIPLHSLGQSISSFRKRNISRQVRIKKYLSLTKKKSFLKTPFIFQKKVCIKIKITNIFWRKTLKL